VKFWEGLIAATGRRDLAADSRFAGRMDRVNNYAALETELAATFAAKPRGEWIELLTRHDVPHAPVLSLAEVVDDPQARHIGLEQRATHPVEGEVRGIRNPIGFAGAPESFVPPPVLGEDDEALRAWLSAPDDQRTKPK
ncbi:MAG: CoA transferase, partial [Alphaproteobacteria bacterium]|nr:CoA transferase [Alphaproteobacteria bacterium]